MFLWVRNSLRDQQEIDFAEFIHGCSSPQPPVSLDTEESVSLNLLAMLGLDPGFDLARLHPSPF